MSSIEDIISAILRSEGGFVNHPADRGGATRFGITIATLSRWRRKPVTIDDVEELSEDEARAIYLGLYVIEPGFDRIKDERLQAFMVDSGVQHGTMAAIILLQRALGVTQDGVLGPITLGALKDWDANKLLLKAVAERLHYYGRILQRDASQLSFAAGWFRRMSDVVAGLA